MEIVCATDSIIVMSKLKKMNNFKGAVTDETEATYKVTRIIFDSPLHCAYRESNLTVTKMNDFNQIYHKYIPRCLIFSYLIYF